MPADSLVHGLLARIADEDEDPADVAPAASKPSPFFAQLKQAVKDAGAPVRGKGG